eukprot:762444-Pleurochrysis_carterae.AAC.2
MGQMNIAGRKKRCARLVFVTTRAGGCRRDDEILRRNALRCTYEIGSRRGWDVGWKMGGSSDGSFWSVHVGIVWRHRHRLAYAAILRHVRKISVRFNKVQFG